GAADPHVEWLAKGHEDPPGQQHRLGPGDHYRLHRRRERGQDDRRPGDKGQDPGDRHHRGGSLPAAGVGTRRGDPRRRGWTRAPSAGGSGRSPAGTWPAEETPRNSGAGDYARLGARSWYSTPMKKPQIRRHTSTANGSFQPSGPSKRNRP